MNNNKKFKPAVDKKILLLLAGLMWIGMGFMLLSFSYSWLSAYEKVSQKKTPLIVKK